MTQRIAMTCNGPGEFAGWVRPLVQTLHTLAPELELHCFFVPDDYATGRESAVARESLPMLTIHEPSDYLRFALGGSKQVGPCDIVLYLGGDVMHAARLHARLGGDLCAYRYAPRSFARHVSHAFALDTPNAELLAKTIAREHISITGNLAVDGAIAQAAQPTQSTIADGIVFLPGSRRYEITHLVPFFATAASRLQRLRPGLPVSFGISPFTEIASIHQALQGPTDARMYAKQGQVIDLAGQPAILMDESQTPIPIVQNALATAVSSKLAITIPGTKCIELAALGVPTIACVPFNIPEKVVMNGPLTYLDRLPGLGTPLKRAAVLAFARRFTYFTQPNMDAGALVLPELTGTLTPGVVAQAALALFDQPEQRDQLQQHLRAIYQPHHGATERMANTLLELLAR